VEEVNKLTSSFKISQKQIDQSFVKMVIACFVSLIVGLVLAKLVLWLL